MPGYPDDQPPRPVDLVPTTATTADPAVNTEWTQTVPAGETWRIYAVRYSLTGGAGLTGMFGVEIVRGGVVTEQVWFNNSGGTAGAGTSFSWLRMLGYQTTTAAVGRPLSLGLPDVVLGPGDIIRSVRAAPDAADNYSAAMIVYAKLAG